jgi:HNH endonuclease
MSYAIKSWQKFQHYKDRKPLWIKLYRDVLDSMDWSELSGIAAKNLIMIWLIGSEYDGDLPELSTLAFRLRVKVLDLEKSIVELCKAGFLIETEEAPRAEKTTSKELREKAGYGDRYVDQLTKDLIHLRDVNCVYCGATENLEIDHVFPVSKGGNSEPENLQLLCRSCNRSKRSKTAEQVATPLGQVAPEGNFQRSLEKEKEIEKEIEEREKENGEPSVSPPRDSFQPEIIFITRGRPKTWTLTNAFLAKAKGIYPNIDLVTQIRLAKVWTESEDHHRKTAKGMETFLLNWFGRCTPSKPQARKQFDADEFLRNKFAEVQS